VVKLSISDVILAPTTYKGAHVDSLPAMPVCRYLSEAYITPAGLLKVWGSSPRIDPVFSG
jgi:hypothetical protein